VEGGGGTELRDFAGVRLWRHGLASNVYYRVLWKNISAAAMKSLTNESPALGFVADGARAASGLMPNRSLQKYLHLAG